MDPRIVLTAAAAGVAIEAIAAALDWWIYHPPWFRAVNILVVFTLIFGWLSSALVASPLWMRFGAGAAFGIAYEGLNLAVLHAWSFPDDRLLFLRGTPALVLGVGLSWGLIPVLIPVAAGVTLS